ncbi:hypothetical protein Bpfe_014898, partial [Biomphalaria pfeifferi]
MSRHLAGKQNRERRRDVKCVHSNQHVTPSGGETEQGKKKSNNKTESKVSQTSPAMEKGANFKYLIDTFEKVESSISILSI